MIPITKIADDAIRGKTFLESRKTLPTHILIEDARGNDIIGKKPCQTARAILKERGIDF